MTEKLLRDTLKEAQTKDQLGLFIWANWTVWDDLGYQTKPGNESYDFAFSQISKGKTATIKANCNGLSMPGFIAVSIQKLNSFDDFFKQVLETCEKGHYEGPITLVPLNEVSENFVK